jgi:hypothetical protein
LPSRKPGADLTPEGLLLRISEPILPFMPLFGAHMSIAGGCHNALLAALKYGCDTVQLFT